MLGVLTLIVLVIAVVHCMMFAELVAMLVRKPAHVFGAGLILVSVMLGVLWNSGMLTPVTVTVFVLSLLPIRMFIYFWCKAVQPNWMSRFFSYRFCLFAMCILWISALPLMLNHLGLAGRL